MSALAAFGVFLLFLCATGVAGAAPGRCCRPNDAGCLADYSGDRIALIVGVNDYKSPEEVPGRLTNLTNAVNDARAVADILGDNAYSIRCLEDPTADDFFTEIDRLKAHLSGRSGSSGNSVVIHFSGHGFQVDDHDYAIFSGLFESKADVIAGGVPLFELITQELASFGQFNITLVIDACRNPGPQSPSWMERPGFKVVSPTTSLVLVYSAQPGHLAHDKSAAIGANDNGAFVFTLKKYFRLHSLELEDVYRAVGHDLAMVKIRQKPEFRANRFSSGEPWAAPMDVCTSSESAAAAKSIGCLRRGGDVKACIAADACPFVEVLERAQRGGLSCNRTALASVFPDIADCATSGRPIAGLLGIVAAPIEVAAAAPDLPTLRRDAVIATASARIEARMAAPGPSRAPASVPAMAPIRDLIGQVEAIQAAAADAKRSAPLREVVSLRNKILQAGRQAGGPDKPFAAATGAALRVPQGPIELQMLPRVGGGTTGPLQPTAPPKVDCQTQYCDSDWVAVRVLTARGAVDGWLPSGQVTAAPAQESIRVDFVDGEYRPTADGLERLAGFLAKLRQDPAAVVKITAVMAKTDQARLLGAARATHVANLLSARAGRPDRVSTRLIETEQFANYPAVTVELFK